MTIHGFDIETWAPSGDDKDALDPHKGEILTIQYQDFEAPSAPVVIHKAWEHPQGERGILADFLRKHRFITNKWLMVPCGWNLVGMEYRWIWVKAKKYGLVGWLDTFEDTLAKKPCIDLQTLAVVAQGGEWKGASLHNYSGKTISGHDIPTHARERRFRDIEEYVIDEMRALRDLYRELLESTPSILQRRN